MRTFAHTTCIDAGVPSPLGRPVLFDCRPNLLRQIGRKTEQDSLHEHIPSKAFESD
jgi:hypothetical protein